MSDVIVVSVICCTYNHNRFIRSALEGFVVQQTDFKFEVLVHDDASTDNTAEIVREYEKKYPDLIKGIYQSENQYSQGVSTMRLATSFAKGEYIAFCEGDDYWTDPLKLQKQYNALKARPDIDICGHSAIKLSNGNDLSLFASGKDNTVLSVPFLINSNTPHAATLMIRKERYIQETKKTSLDYFIRIRCSEPNGMLYLKDIMSVYRKGVRGSWTRRIGNNVNTYDSFLKGTLYPNLLSFNQETNYIYDNEIKKQLRSLKFGQTFGLHNYKKVLGEYADILESCPLTMRLRTRIFAFSPVLGNIFGFVRFIGRLVLALPYRWFKYHKYLKIQTEKKTNIV